MSLRKIWSREDIFGIFFGGREGSRGFRQPKKFTTPLVVEMAKFEVSKGEADERERILASFRIRYLKKKKWRTRRKSISKCETLELQNCSSERRSQFVLNSAAYTTFVLLLYSRFQAKKVDLFSGNTELNSYAWRKFFNGFNTVPSDLWFSLEDVEQERDVQSRYLEYERILLKLFGILDSEM